MKEVIDKLHKEFSELIAGDVMKGWLTSNKWAQENLKIGRDAKMAPAFFIEELTHYSDEEARADQLVADLALPFEAFWICSRWSQDNVASSNFAFFHRSLDVLKVAIYFCAEVRDDWRGTAISFAGNTSFAPNVASANRMEIREALKLVDVINLSSERIEAAPNLLVRQRLAKGGLFKKQTQFITVRPYRFTQQTAGANGSSKSPHNRRGHWRRYRSGKEVWIQDCTIHGGSKGGRDYAVLKIKR